MNNVYNYIKAHRVKCQEMIEYCCETEYFSAAPAFLDDLKYLIELEKEIYIAKEKLENLNVSS